MTEPSEPSEPPDGHPRDQLTATMARIYARRMTTTSGGNLSVRGANGDVWITPAGVDKGRLAAADIVCVSADGAVRGPHRPSSELPFHRAVYAARPDLGAIVHAHPTGLVAFSISKQVPDTRVFRETHAICGEPAFARYALPGSATLGDRIAAEFAAGRQSVILENHGVVVAAETLARAFERFETLEFTAQAILRAREIGAPRPLGDAELALDARGASHDGLDPPAPDACEARKREQVCAFAKRAYDQRLLISTIGSFSARVGDDRFVVTPSDVDRAALRPEDLVLVDGGRRARGRPVGPAAALHRALYRAHPGVGAIAQACPVSGSAFAITGRPLDSRTIPESYLVLRDVGSIPYAAQFGGDAPAAQLSERQPAAVVANAGVITVGAGVLEAFDRLEVLEATASALISAGSLGEVSPMPAAAVDELRRVFLGES